MANKLYEALESRILLLDGGFGTMVQQYGFTEEDYRGERFRDWNVLLKGCNDLLAVTRPGAVREIHVKYLQAGADIIETDSFNANAVSLADYGLDEPALTITATDADGTAYTFSIGDQNEVTQEYYLLYNGDSSKVYMVDSTLQDTFSLGLYDMVQMESLPMFGTVTGLSVTQPGGSVSVSYVEDSESLYYDSSVHWFLEQEDGTQLALDTGKVTSLTSSVTGLTWISGVNYDADDQELAAWGLDEDTAVKVVLTY